MKKSRVNKLIVNITFIILIIIVIVSAHNIFKIVNQYYQNKKAYIEVKEDVVSINEGNYLSNDDYNKLKEINDDFSFWLTIQDTNIDYPVVHSKDNEEYLYKNFYKEDNKGGSIFIDYNNSLDDENIIIHGHNMKDKSMFGTLKLFNDQSFLDQNKKIYIYLKNETLEFEVFSLYVEKADEETYKKRFYGEQEYKEYIENVVIKSFYDLDSNIDEISKSKIITLSTCQNAIGDERLIVHGRLSNKQEITNIN